MFGCGASPFVYCGSVVGGVGWFLLLRALSQHCGLHVQRCADCCPSSSSSSSSSASSSLYLRAFTSALESRPVQTTALLQLSFLPYGALGALLSTTSLSASSFLLGCCLSRLKLLSYIWMAQSASALQSLWSSERQWGWRDVTTLLLSVSLSLVALSLVTLFATASSGACSWSRRRRTLRRRRGEGRGERCCGGRTCGWPATEGC